MEKKVLEEIAKMRSLTQRMDMHLNEFDASKHVEETLTEMAKKISTSADKEVNWSNFFDIMDQMETDTTNKGRFYNLYYAPSVKVPNKTKSAWRTEDVTNALGQVDMEKYGNSEWFKSLSDFNKEDTTLTRNPIEHVLVIQHYYLHWESNDSINTRYGEYANKRKELRGRFGLPELMRQVSDTEKDKPIGYGSLTATSTGKIDKLIDKNKIDWNNTTFHCYIVDNEGNIGEEIDHNVLKSMISAGSSHSSEAKLLSPEAFAEYHAEMVELEKTIQYQKLTYPNILMMSANAGGGIGSFWTVNPEPSVTLSKDKKTGETVIVDPAQLIKKVRELDGQFKKDRTTGEMVPKNPETQGNEQFDFAQERIK